MFIAGPVVASVPRHRDHFTQKTPASAPDPRATSSILWELRPWVGRCVVRISTSGYSSGALSARNASARAFLVVSVRFRPGPYQDPLNSHQYFFPLLDSISASNSHPNSLTSKGFFVTLKPGQTPVGMQVSEAEAAEYIARTLGALRKSGSIGALLWWLCRLPCRPPRRAAARPCCARAHVRAVACRPDAQARRHRGGREEWTHLRARSRRAPVVGHHSRGSSAPTAKATSSGCTGATASSLCKLTDRRQAQPASRSSMPSVHVAWLRQANWPYSPTLGYQTIK